jgi:SAM-dependent methyltransferase
VHQTLAKEPAHSVSVQVGNVKWQWNLLAKLWYPVLSYLTRNVPVTFLNYGYASDRPSARAPVLEEQDEADRCCIQLYHHVAGAIDLTGRSVLEVSCGHGGGASYMARYLEPRSVRGVDRNPEAIKLCKRRHKLPGLTFSCGNAMALDFAGESFDVVVNIEASHCYPDLARFFREVLRVLRPGGYFLYADFRDNDPGRAVVHRHVETSGLELIREENISREVIRGMQLNTEKYARLIRQLAPRFMRKPATSFAGLKGSPVYNALESGETVYFCYVLRKPGWD